MFVQVIGIRGVGVRVGQRPVHVIVRVFTANVARVHVHMMVVVVAVEVVVTYR